MSRIYYKLFPGIPGNCGISKKFPDVAPDDKGCLPLMTRCQYLRTTTTKTNKPNKVPSFFLQTGVGNWLISLRWEDLVSVNDTACPIAPGLGFGAKNLKLMQKGREGVPYRSFQNGCAVKSVCNDDNCKVYRQDESITIRRCDFNRCESDLCNGAEVPTVSGVVFLVCSWQFFAVKTFNSIKT